VTGGETWHKGRWPGEGAIDVLESMVDCRRPDETVPALLKGTSVKPNPLANDLINVPSLLKAVGNVPSLAK
jgi:hypothetical protein